MKSAVYKASLVYPAVNRKNITGYCTFNISMHFAEEIYICDNNWPVANYLDFQYTQQFFSLSLQYNDFAHSCFLSLASYIAFSYERSPLSHNIKMLAPRTELYFNEIHALSRFMTARKQIVDDQSIKL